MAGDPVAREWHAELLSEGPACIWEVSGSTGGTGHVLYRADIDAYTGLAASGVLSIEADTSMVSPVALLFARPLVAGAGGEGGLEFLGLIPEGCSSAAADVDALRRAAVEAGLSASLEPIRVLHDVYEDGCAWIAASLLEESGSRRVYRVVRIDAATGEVLDDGVVQWYGTEHRVRLR